MRFDTRHTSGTALLLLFSLTATISARASSPENRQWSVDGVTRTGIVYAPESAKNSPAPVIFAFHGHGGSAQNSARKFAYQSLWPEAIVVYLQGLPTPGKFDPEGKKPGWQKTPGDQNDRDLHFFDAVLAGLQQEFTVDSKRIYCTGHSNGGGFTYLLWAQRGEVFAAVAPSAGGAGRHARNLKPLPALHVAGEQDTRVPFENQLRTMQFVRTLNGCAADGVPWASAGTLTGTLYPSASGTPFVSVIYPGTHTFPDEAPGLIAKFFREHARP